MFKRRDDQSFLYATFVASTLDRCTFLFQINSPTVDFSSFILILNSLPLILRHVLRFFLFFPFLSFLSFLSFSFHPRSFPQPDTVLNYVSFCNDHVPFCSLILRELVRLLIAPVFLLPFNVTVVRALGGAVSEFVKSPDCSFAKKFEKNLKVFSNSLNYLAFQFNRIHHRLLDNVIQNFVRSCIYVPQSTIYINKRIKTKSFL